MARVRRDRPRHRRRLGVRLRHQHRRTTAPAAPSSRPPWPRPPRRSTRRRLNGKATAVDPDLVRLGRPLGLDRRQHRDVQGRPERRRVRRQDLQHRDAAGEHVRPHRLGLAAAQARADRRSPPPAPATRPTSPAPRTPSSSTSTTRTPASTGTASRATRSTASASPLAHGDDAAGHLPALRPGRAADPLPVVHHDGRPRLLAPHGPGDTMPPTSLLADPAIRIAGLRAPSIRPRHAA